MASLLISHMQLNGMLIGLIRAAIIYMPMFLLDVRAIMSAIFSKNENYHQKPFDPYNFHG